MFDEELMIGQIYLEISGLCLYFYQGAYATIGQGGSIVSDLSAL